MTPRTRRSAGVRNPADPLDPLEREIEAALRPGRFVSCSAGFDFVEDLEAVGAGSRAQRSFLERASTRAIPGRLRSRAERPSSRMISRRAQSLASH
jgi:hypothetical protein